MTHAALTRTYVSVELEDGSTYVDVRILFKDVAAFMKAARINKWDTEDAVTQQVFTAWHAGKRSGHWDCTFETFRDELLADLDAARVDKDEDETEDPTPAS